MPHLDMEEVVDQLSPEFKRALKRTLEKETNNENVNVNQFLRTFKRELGRACSSNAFVTDVCVLD